MCGIVGFWGLDCCKEEMFSVLRDMSGVIVHRGPDDEGYVIDEKVGLGMRRLSIIDLQTGKQPITSEDGLNQIVFNGEIYNYLEIKKNLENLGEYFSTNSDTEVILKSYMRFGDGCVNYLNGMFAFAIWDKRRNRLFIGRDRMGVKPLYYYWDGRLFLFGSEIKAIIASKRISPQINTQSLSHYLTFRYVPQPDSIFENIKKLPPAHTLSITPDQQEPVIKRYWDIPYNDDSPVLRMEEYEEQFTCLFQDAVRKRLIADVPIGVLLSGGLDSSCVAMAIRENGHQNLNSFSVAFEDAPDINELKYAKMVATCFGMNHHEILISKNDFCDFLPRMVHYTDEPLADLASVPLYYVSKLAHQSVKVVLSGEGSDEILGGYELDAWSKVIDLRQRFQKIPLKLRNNLAKKIIKRLNPGWMGYLKALNSSIDQRQLQIPQNMTYLMSAEEKKHFLKEGLEVGDSEGLLRREIARVETNIPLHQLLFLYCQSWLVEDLLMKADKMSMSNSIELRTPFLDYRLVEWAAQTPAWVKVGKNRQGVLVTKNILRNYAHKSLPKEIINRPKMGFPVPVYDWLSSSLKGWVFDLFSGNKISVHEWLRPAMVNSLVKAGTAPDASLKLKHQLWNIIVLELWSREWNKK